MIFYGVPFYDTCLNLFNISCLCCGGIFTSLAFLEFGSCAGIGFIILSEIFSL